MANFTNKKMFYNELLGVRTRIDDNNKVWYCAADVCAALGFEFGFKTFVKIPADFVAPFALKTSKSDIIVNFVSEAGLYCLLLQEDKDFARLVCEAVLPEVRKGDNLFGVRIQGYLGIINHIEYLTRHLAIVKDLFNLQTTVALMRKANTLLAPVAK